MSTKPSKQRERPTKLPPKYSILTSGLSPSQDGGYSVTSCQLREFLFVCFSVMMMQMMLSNIAASFSGSSELNKIFNQLGITVSYESLHRYITKVVNLMNEDNMKMSFVPNGFVLTSVDNIDKGTPHASLSFGSSKCGLHRTSVQALQPKPHSIKNSPDDYVMFHRQSSLMNWSRAFSR